MSGQALTLSKIEQRTKLNLRHPEDLIVIMRDNPKILWDLTTDRYGLRNKYEIKDKHELLDHMRRTPEGLPNNQDLWDCYKGVEKDVDELKRLSKVRIVRNEEKKVDLCSTETQTTSEALRAGPDDAGVGEGPLEDCAERELVE